MEKLCRQFRTVEIHWNTVLVFFHSEMNRIIIAFICAPYSQIELFKSPKIGVNNTAGIYQFLKRHSS